MESKGVKSVQVIVSVISISKPWKLSLVMRSIVASQRQEENGVIAVEMTHRVHVILEGTRIVNGLETRGKCGQDRKVCMNDASRL